jgi:protein translocase SecG subunit
MLDLIIIVIAIILTILILLQPRGEMSGIFGGWSGSFYYKRRGIEKYVFYLTIFFSAIFLIFSLLRAIV